MGATDPGRREILLALVWFAASSIGMMMGNKVATNHLPLPSALISLQAVCTIIPLLFNSDTLGLQRGLMKSWFPVATLFALMLFSSMQSFLYCNVSTILVFRNMATILSTGVEYVVRGIHVNCQIIAAQVLIVLGCVIYGWGQLGLSALGFFWIFVNIIAQVVYGNIVKVYLSGLKDANGNPLNKQTCAYYNNVLGLPYFLGSFFYAEVQALQDEVMGISTTGWLVIGFTCIAGYFLATSGFGLQKLVSATTFLVVNNMIKIANILLGMLILKDRFTGPLAMLGCCISLGAGIWYSYEQNQWNDAQANKATV